MPGRGDQSAAPAEAGAFPHYEKNPYDGFPEKAFWKPAVGSREPEKIDQLWDPKFEITRDTKIATYGSCFAQHFSRQLVARGFRWLNTEAAPEVVDEAVAASYNYGIYSARTGNIYSAASLLQWLTWARANSAGAEEAWEEGGRVYDPFRPNIEPDGFASIAEMMASRRVAIEAFRRSVKRASIFVFTMGLTEGWVNTATEVCYPVCPGTLHGEFDRTRHSFVNSSYRDIMRDMSKALRLLRRINPSLQILLTVSPVPLTATASGNHVLTATTYSKSVLRAVAGTLQGQNDFVDYFPSYEIITAPAFRGQFFNDNMRTVTSEGVAFVMKAFFAALGEELASPLTAPVKPKKKLIDSQAEDDLVCEEELLDAFSAGGGR